MVNLSYFTECKIHAKGERFNLLNELHLFAGAGGGILGGILLGHRPVCAVEIEPYCRSVLLQRQRDGALPWFPIWDDVRTFDGTPWRGIADIVCGGFPCQDISAAGKGAGITGERSGLWVEMARVIREVRPRYAFVENSPMLVGRGLGRVLGDLAEMGFDARWGVVAAEDAAWLAGNPAVYHERERIWILAEHADTRREHGNGREGEQRTANGKAPQRVCGGANANATESSGEVTDATRIQQGWQEQRAERKRVGAGGESADADTNGEPEDWLAIARRQCRNWLVEPRLGRVSDGVAHRVDRLKAIGNGQVCQVAALAWRILNAEFKKEQHA